MPSTLDLITFKKVEGLSLLICEIKAASVTGAMADDPLVNLPRLSWATVNISAPASVSYKKVAAAVPVSTPLTAISWGNSVPVLCS